MTAIRARLQADAINDIKRREQTESDAKFVVDMLARLTDRVGMEAAKGLYKATYFIDGDDFQALQRTTKKLEEQLKRFGFEFSVQTLQQTNASITISWGYAIRNESLNGYDGDIYEAAILAGCKAEWHDGMLGWKWHCMCDDNAHCSDQQCSVLTHASIQRGIDRRRKNNQ